MLTKDTVRALVTALLREQVEALYLKHSPDAYYGWVAPKTLKNGKVVPGYWIGEEAMLAAQHRTIMAQITFDHACDLLLDVSTDSMLYPSIRAAADAAACHYYEACRDEDNKKRLSERVVAMRRDKVIERRIANLFVKTFRRASVLNWNLFHPAIPHDLRLYIQRQRARGAVSPVSMVLMYLVTRSTIEHGKEHQLNAITGLDYLASNPLATADVDIEAAENEPEKQSRQYVRALQSLTAAEAVPPAHDNHDPRDARADFGYDGLPEQLGALWIPPDDNACTTCGHTLRVKLVHAKAGYCYANVCGNYRKGCSFDKQSPIFATRRDAKDWATVEWATAAAAS